MYGEVTSRNHQAYNWGTSYLTMTLNIDSATECSFANPVILLKTRCSFFPQNWENLTKKRLQQEGKSSSLDLGKELWIISD